MDKRAKPGNLKKKQWSFGNRRYSIAKYFDFVISWLSAVFKLMLRQFPSCCCRLLMQCSGFNLIKIKLGALKLKVIKSILVK